MHWQAVLLSYRHDARIANAADLNRRAVVSDVGMADGPSGPGHASWLVRGADDVKRCRKVEALPALFCCVRLGFFLIHRPRLGSRTGKEALLPISAPEYRLVCHEHLKEVKRRAI